MEKYSLLLKGLKKETPNEVFLPDLEGPRPITGDTIDPIGFKRLLENIAVKESSFKYVSNFAYSKFKITEVRHMPEYKEGKFETILLVIANKI